jgi:hypothetical protein
VQDDRDEWEKESGNMTFIYQGSFITLAASIPNDAHGGLFYVSPPDKRQRRVEIGHHGGLAVGMRHSIDHESIIVDGGSSKNPFPLIKRAWVYQERLLSPRFLHFTSEELMFECGEGSSCECSDAVDWDSPLTFASAYEPKKHYVQALASLTRTSLPQYWRELVEQYSRLDLSFPSDRLPALSGLAKQMAKFRKVAYLAGLWESSIIDDLLWKADDPSRISNGLTPTWSWARTNGAIRYLSGHQDSVVLCTVTEACCTPAGRDPHGEVKSGFLRACGMLIPVMLTEIILNVPKEVKRGKSGYGTSVRIVLKCLATGLVAEVDLDLPLEQYNTSLYYLPLVMVHGHENGLLLKRVKDFPSTFERVGVVMWDDNSIHTQKHPKTTFKIV